MDRHLFSTVKHPHSVLALCFLAIVGCKGPQTAVGPTGDTSLPTNVPTNVPTEVPTGTDPCAPPVSGQVDTSTTLLEACSPYELDSDLVVFGGATLTIEPGVEVRFAFDTGVRVEDGVLDALGTLEDPIVFTSSELVPVPGSWNGIELASPAQVGTQFVHTRVEFGGFAQEACLVDRSARSVLVLEDVTFVECENGGLQLGVSAPRSLTGLVFEDIVGFGLSSSPEHAGTLIEPSTYINVPYNSLVAGTVETSATWTDQDVPWRVFGQVSVKGDTSPVLTLEPGTELEFTSAGMLSIASNEPGGLIAVGTPASPIVFRSSSPSPAPGDWRGITFGEETVSGTELRHVEVHHAGENGSPGSEAAIFVATDRAETLTISDTLIADALGAGVYASSADLRFASFENNVFRGLVRGFRVWPGTVSSIGPGHVFDATPSNQIRGSRLDEDATWIAQDVPYQITDDLTVSGSTGPTLSLEVGVHLQFDAGTRLEIGRVDSAGLVVNGTAAAPVVLESSNASPLAGDWVGVVLEDNIQGNTSLTHLTVRHGGDPSILSACLQIRGAHQERVAIVDSVFEACEGAGIQVRTNGFTFGVVSGLTFSDVPAGFHVPASAVGGLDTVHTYTNTPTNRIDGGTFRTSAVWNDQGVPWRVSDDIEVSDSSGPVLTIEPGVELLFEGNSGLEVGRSGAGGLSLVGTATDLITLAGQTAGPGTWHGIHISGDVLPGTLLRHVEVRDAGESGSGTQGAITLIGALSNVEIDQVSFVGNALVDIHCNASSTPVLTGLDPATVIDCNQ